MKIVPTVRMDADFLERAEARAARSGVDKEDVRWLIEKDLASGSEMTGVGFASSDLAGIYEGSGKAATNQETRVRMRRKS